MVPDSFVAPKIPPILTVYFTPLSLGVEIYIHWSPGSSVAAIGGI